MTIEMRRDMMTYGEPNDTDTGQPVAGVTSPLHSLTGVVSVNACYHQPWEQSTDFGCRIGNRGSRRRLQMNCVIPSTSNSTRGDSMALCLVLVHVVFAAATFATAQDTQQRTERRDLGFEGPVRSVLTKIA